MPFQHHIDSEHRLLVIQGLGGGHLEEIADSIRQAIARFVSGEIPRHYGVLLDVSRTALIPTIAEARQIEDLISRIQEHTRGPIAILAVAIDKMVPARIIAMNATTVRHEVQAFDEDAEARAWLAAQMSQAIDRPET